MRWVAVVGEIVKANADTRLSVTVAQRRLGISLVMMSVSVVIMSKIG